MLLALGTKLVPRIGAASSRFLGARHGQLAGRITRPWAGRGAWPGPLFWRYQPDNFVVALRCVPQRCVDMNISVNMDMHTTRRAFFIFRTDPPSTCTSTSRSPRTSGSSMTIIACPLAPPHPRSIRDEAKRTTSSQGSSSQGSSSQGPAANGHRVSYSGSSASRSFPLARERRRR